MDINIDAINKKISEYPYVHIIYNDKFCIPIIEFIHNNFGNEEHLFLVQRFFDNFPMPEGESILEFGSMEGMDFSSNSVKRVIMHSLFTKTCFRYWYSHSDIQAEKAYWILYGGDLYEAPTDEMAIAVRSGFRGYISDTDGDCEVARKKYNLVNKEYICASYSFPITLDMLKTAMKQKEERESVRIQVNNSCDKTTLDMFEKLRKFADKDMEIVTVLSYGLLQYKEEIIKKGKEYFGSKFSYLEELLSPAEYAKWIALNDIYILNQDRQQGLGNAIASLSCGKKVYIKREITTYTHFMSRDIQIFDSNQIGDLEWDDFIYYDEGIKSRSMMNARMFYDDAYLKKCWEPVFK